MKNLLLLLIFSFFFALHASASQMYLYPESSYWYGTTSSTQTISTTSLVSYWKLDGNSNDSVGSNNGTDTNITYGTDYGKIGQGISLNGSSSYIQMPNSIVTSGTSISVSLWLKNGNAAQAIDETVFSNQYDPGQHGCILARSSAGTVNEYSLFFGVGDSSGWQGFGDYKFAISTSSWEHYVFVINGKNRIIYRNGASIDDRSYAKNLSLTSADKFTISRKPNEAKRFWEGVVDEVGVWSTALSSTTVKALYEAQKDRYLQYPFTEYSTTTLFSVSSTNYLLTTSTSSTMDENTKYIVVLLIISVLIGLVGLVRKMMAR